MPTVCEGRIANGTVKHHLSYLEAYARSDSLTLWRMSGDLGRIVLVVSFGSVQSYTDVRCLCPMQRVYLESGSNNPPL